MTLGENLRETRKRKSFSQDQVARHLSISRQSISKWENNTTLPDIYQLTQLAELYEVSLEQLVHGIKDIENQTASERVSQGDMGEKGSKKTPAFFAYDKMPVLINILIAILLISSTAISILGVLISISILTWAKKLYRPIYFWVKIIAVVCLLLSINNFLILLSVLFIEGEGTITPL